MAGSLLIAAQRMAAVAAWAPSSPIVAAELFDALARRVLPRPCRTLRLMRPYCVTCTTEERVEGLSTAREQAMVEQ
jgi:hypothetical protein